jgi:hypothetical protein
MKRSFTLCVLLLTVFAGVASAKRGTTSTADPSTPTSVGTVYHIGQCKFRVDNLYGGAFSSGEESGGYTGLTTINNPVFVVYCHADASQDDIDELLDAKKINGKWVWYNPGAGNVPENPPFTPEQHFHVYSFSGKNWKGTAITYDDTTGDEATRGRNLFFCLVENNGPQVLCSSPISVRLLSDPPSTSTLPKIMAALKTIVFVDTPPASAASASK